MPRLVVLSLLASLTCFTCPAQQTSVEVVTAPVATDTVATDALMLLAQHQAAMGGVDFTALQGTGTIMLPGSTSPLPADLVIAGSSFLRVSIHNSDHLIGFAAKGFLHKSYYTDGTSSIDAVGTGPASICAFQLLRTTDVMSKLLSLSKDTSSDVGGRLYDRLQARQALSTSPGKQLSAKSKTVPVIYYFDPATHYLVKSETTLQISGIANPIPLETTYSDYRSVGSSMVPFRISQMLNGQQDWTLTLTSVTLSAKLDSSLTTF